VIIDKKENASEIKQSFIFSIEKFSFSKWHSHGQAYELVYILNGSGKWLIGDNIDFFSSNSVYLLGPGLPHQWQSSVGFQSEENELSVDAFVVQFSGMLIHDFLQFPENIQLKDNFQKANLGISFNADDSFLIANDLKKMSISKPKQQLYQLLEIFNKINNVSHVKTLSSDYFLGLYQAETHSGLLKVVDFIMVNFQKKILMKELLEIANMSSTSFSVNFKRSFKLSFSEFILDLRLKYARKLLAKNELSIFQIADDSGFDNLSNFNRLFKKNIGITPKEYRSKNLE
jgi:AraC-like DNA-binding protein